MIALYDLSGGDGRRFSPYCWRVQMALAHKQLDYRTVATRFADISSIGDGTQKTVPVIDDDGRMIADSWKIANYLEGQYPDRPSLFGGPAGHALTLFVQSWVFDVLHRGDADMMVPARHGEWLGDHLRGARVRRFPDDGHISLMMNRSGELLDEVLDLVGGKW